MNSIFHWIALGSFLFWLWALIDCLTREPAAGNKKLIWVLVIVFLYILGALSYVFVRRPERARELGI